MTKIADIFITTKDRPHLLDESLKSLFECTELGTYSLTVIDDSGNDASTETRKLLESYFAEGMIDNLIIHRQNLGLGPSINEALATIETRNVWHDDPNAPLRIQIAPFICYSQDDIFYTKGWLKALAQRFVTLEKQYNLGFASGIESIEHKEDFHDLGGGMQLKRYIRAANMFARREYWMSMYPITRFDPETRSVRRKPDNGMGSGVDWHFIRNHPNSVEKTGRRCLVMPGLLQHAGYAQSTWLKRELPESESDKQKVKERVG